MGCTLSYGSVHLFSTQASESCLFLRESSVQLFPSYVTMRIHDVFAESNVVNYEVVVEEAEAADTLLPPPPPFAAEDGLWEEAVAAPTEDLVALLVSELANRAQEYVGAHSIPEATDYVPPWVLWSAFVTALLVLFYQFWSILSLARLKRKIL